MTKSESIQLIDLSTGFSLKRGRKKYLHKHINLALYPCELVCILGPNGAGKSTLLRTLLGFENLLDGEVLFNKDPLKNISIREMARLVSVVLTDKIDDIYLTAREVIATARYPYSTFNSRLTKEDILIIDNIEKQIGISQLTDRKFAQLSDGEKQKIMIARSLVQETPFIFLDEPVAFIDAPSRVGIMQLLHQMVHEMGKGILMASHDLDSALNYADKIWLLGNDGQWDSGSPDELLKAGKINQYFDKENVTFDSRSKRFNWKEK